MAVFLQVSQICKRYGAHVLLEDASVSFDQYQKVGVIGRNGAGKSTLCKIITGEMEPDSGSIIKNSNLRLSYLEQHDPYEKGETITDFLMRYTGKEEWECGEMAARFLIPYEFLSKQISALAGGFQTRVKLTAMLLRDPNFLILDEPSNYLDLSTLILLENFLMNFKGGYLIVSHDREFLKKTCEHTLEVENTGVTLYPGNIEDYFEFKEENIRQKQAYNRTIEKKKEQMQDFIDRFRAKASTASRAKSRQKQMDKLETIEIAHTLHEVNIRIPKIEKKAGVALECNGLAIGYPSKEVASDIHLSVDRGERVAVLGDNGQGKTTFFRTIAADLAPKGGEFKWGPSLNLAYYAQHVFQTLHPQDDIFAHLMREAADGVTVQDVKDMAGSFLFKGDDIKKKVSVLSGGERARLCLAGLLLSKCQVLLLDEPTNHLDFETVEALGEALQSFNGTVFFISHDRTFVNLVATSIIDIKDGRVRRYPGVYEDYVYHLELQARGEESPGGEATPKKREPKVSGKDAENQEDSASQKQARKKNKAELTRLKIKMKKVETRIANLNKEKNAIMKEMAENPFFYSKQKKEQLKIITDHIAEEEESWLVLQEEWDQKNSNAGTGAKAGGKE